MKNNKLNLIVKAIFVLVILLGSIPALHAKQKKQTVKHDYLVAAYIWPSCHDDPLARQKLWS